jgi:hypothetical protein
MNIFGYIKVGKRVSKAHRLLFEGKTLIMWYKDKPIIGTMIKGKWYNIDINGNKEMLIYQSLVTHVSFLPSLMKTEKEKILAIIAEIQAEREADHIVPPHVLTAEIINRGFQHPYQTLNELCAEGKINWCRTLNDMAFTIRK